LLSSYEFSSTCVFQFERVLLVIVGYARVSTQDQDTALQLDALSKLGCDVVFQEKASGATRRGRPELARCLASLNRGDVFVVYKIDRIARSLFDLLDILRHLERVGATIKSVTEPLDTTNSMGVFMIQILGAVAQLERSMIRERSIAGQLAARARGRLPGRNRALESSDEAALVREYLEGNTTYRSLAVKYGCSESVAKRAVYRITKSAEYLKRGRV
jgi:DNA invertase Pin-like site-specific DNA recombinase